MRRTRIGILLVILLLPVPAGAGVSLPLEGFFKTGKRVPVRVDGADVTSTLRADGAVPTQIDVSLPRIVPFWIVTSRPGPLSVEHVGRQEDASVPPWRELSRDEVLIGFSGDDRSMPPGLFEGKRVLAVRIEPADLANSEPRTWEALDAVVVDAVPAGWTVANRDAVRNGVTLILRGPPVEPHAAWKTAGAFSILAPAPDRLDAVPTAESLDLPDDLRSDQPISFRRRAVLVGVLFSLAVGASLLAGGKRGQMIALAVAVAFLIGIAIWRTTLVAVKVHSGWIVVDTEAGRTVDRWDIYTAARSASPVRVELPPGAEPYLESVRQVSATRLSLNVTRQSGATIERYVAELKDGHRIVSVRRDVELPPLEEAIADRVTSPMAAIGRLYLKAGEKMRQSPLRAPEEGMWNPVLIDTRR